MVNHRAPWDYPTQRQVATLAAAANAPACEKLSRGAAISAWKMGGLRWKDTRKQTPFLGPEGKRGWRRRRPLAVGKKGEAVFVSGPRGGLRC